jgi:hypothetical protein
MLKNLYNRFTTNVADPGLRAKVLALMGGKLGESERCGG